MESDQKSKLPCDGKLSFETKEQAKATALAADWQHGAVLKAYKCKHCGLWHLSSSSG